jgi:hypothetical protein
VPCLQWVQADRGVTVAGGFATAWADQTGNGWHFAEGVNPPAYLAMGLNGRPVVDFNGTSQQLKSLLTRPAPGTSNTFIWALINVVAATGVANGKPYGGTASMVVFLPSSVTYTPSYFAGTIAAPAITGSYNTWYRWENLYGNTAADYLKIGALVGTGPAIAGNTAEGAAFWLGGNSGAQFCRCTIGAYGAFGGKPNGTELTALAAWAQLYGGAGVQI